MSIVRCEKLWACAEKAHARVTKIRDDLIRRFSMSTGAPLIPDNARGGGVAGRNGSPVNIPVRSPASPRRDSFRHQPLKNQLLRIAALHAGHHRRDLPPGRLASRMTDAAHNQHSETRRPSDRDRIVTTGPSCF